jgi:hypothetical protein
MSFFGSGRISPFSSLDCIFLDYLDKLGLRRYPILVVAHTSHKEHRTVTNESLILVGPRHEQGITVTWLYDTLALRWSRGHCRKLGNK